MVCVCGGEVNGGAYEAPLKNLHIIYMRKPFLGVWLKSIMEYKDSEP